MPVYVAFCTNKCAPVTHIDINIFNIMLGRFNFKVLNSLTYKNGPLCVLISHCDFNRRHAQNCSVYFLNILFIGEMK